jgi:hypothetical protein
MWLGMDGMVDDCYYQDCSHWLELDGLFYTGGFKCCFGHRLA